MRFLLNMEKFQFTWKYT